MDYEHMEFVEAIETLATQAGLEIPYEETGSTPTKREPDSQALYELMNEIKQFYQSQLKENAAAINYLKSRSLTGEISRDAGIGFAPDSWDALLKQFGTTPERIKQLTAAGMLITKENNQHYDRFRNRIMFPIHDRRGKVIGFGGRVLDDSLPKYLNSPETVIFHKGNELYGLYEARKNNRSLERLLVVEGYMDVIGLRQHDIHYAVATLGTATTTHHLQQLFRLCPEVIFCFDGDNAGRAAAWRALETFLPMSRDNWQPKFIFLPTKEDPDTMVRQEGKTAFEKRLRTANSLSEFFLQHLVKQVDLATLDGKARLASLAMPYIEKVSAPFLQQLLLAELSKITRMPADRLKRQLHQPEIQTQKQLKTVLPKNKISPIRHAITLLVQHPHLATTISGSLPNFETAGLPLLHELFTYLQSRTKTTTAQLLEHWRDTETGTHLGALATQPLYIPEQGLEQEFRDCITTIQSQAQQQMIQQLMAKAAAKTITDDERKQLRNLLRQK